MWKAIRLAPIVLWVVLSACGSQNEDACPGATAGACGLEGTCVECVTDRDCPFGHYLMQPTPRDSICETDADCWVDEICINGQCIRPQRCSLDGECIDLTRCDSEYGSGCADQETCLDGWCEPACTSDADCDDGLGTCEPDGGCSYQRCSTEGACPDGSSPVPGSLACAD